MPSKLSEVKDSELRRMTGGSMSEDDGFNLLQEVRNKTIRAVVDHMLEKSDLCYSIGSITSQQLINKLSV